MRDKNRRNLVSIPVLVAVAMMLAACGSGVSGGTVEEPEGTTSSFASEGNSNTNPAVKIPQPDYSWEFDGDATASFGGADVEMLGAFEMTTEAVSLDGYTGHGVADAGLVDTAESFTLSVWVNYAKKLGFSTAVGLLGADSYAAALGIGYDSEWFFATKSADVTGFDNAVAIQTVPFVPGNRWTHLAGVYDIDRGLISFYVDGEKIGEAATEALFAAGGPFTIGRGQFDGGPGNFWAGAIGSVAVYQAALTGEHISAVYESTRPASPPPPVPAPDSSTYADGILNGTWDFTLEGEAAALLIENYSDYVDDAQEVVIRIGFDNHEFWQGVLFDGELVLESGFPEGSAGTLFVEEDVLIFGDGPDGALVIGFTLDGTELNLDLLEFCIGDTCSEPSDPFQAILFKGTYTKSSDDPGY